MNLNDNNREQNVFYNIICMHKVLSEKCRRRLKIIAIVLFVFILFFFILFFVGLPVAFMASIEFQRLVMFTNLNLPSKESYFENYEATGKRNLYVSVRDQNSSEILSLGVWHLLPLNVTLEAADDPNFDYDASLKDSNYSVLLYFHGTGEARSYSIEKYFVFRFFFHVITFDYRSYADSTEAVLSEDAVISDSIRLYDWLCTKTDAPIYIWGHSLGTALATRTMAELRSRKLPKGLMLEAPFTSMRDELYFNPISKIFAWLPWFASTILDPLEKNGFLFDTSKNILKIDTPIMILTAEDDQVVPYRFPCELFELMKNRTKVQYHQFRYDLGYGHNFIYQDPFLPYYIRDFIQICQNYPLYHNFMIVEKKLLNSKKLNRL